MKALVWMDEHLGAIMLGWITGSLIASITFRFSPSLLISLVFSIILIAIRLNNIHVKYDEKREKLEKEWRRKRGKIDLSSL